MSRKRRKKNNARKWILVATLVLVTCVLGYNIVKVYQKNMMYEKRLENLKEAYEEETERQDELNIFEEFTKTLEYVEQIAREKLGLVFKNEIIFKQED